MDTREVIARFNEKLKPLNVNVCDMTLVVADRGATGLYQMLLRLGTDNSRAFLVFNTEAVRKQLKKPSMCQLMDGRVAPVYLWQMAEKFTTFIPPRTVDWLFFHADNTFCYSLEEPLDEALDALVTTLFDAPARCTVCLEEFGTSETTFLKCKHHFHSKCIAEWFRKNQSCPICRTPDTLTEWCTIVRRQH